MLLELLEIPLEIIFLAWIFTCMRILCGATLIGFSCWLIYLLFKNIKEKT